MLPKESRNRKSQNDHQAAILKMTSLKINSLLPIYVSIVPLQFGVDFQSQSKVRVWKGGHFESYVAEINKLLPMATINMHMKFEIEIPKQTWLMLRKPCYYRQTDGRTDGQDESSNPPPTSLVGGIKNNRVPLLYCVKLCASFQSHHWILTRVIVRKPSIRVKIDDFLAVWLCNLTYDLEKQ